MAANMNVAAALGALPSLPPGSIKARPLPAIGARNGECDGGGGAAGSPKKRRSPRPRAAPAAFAAKGGADDAADDAAAEARAVEHRRMLCRALPPAGTALAAPGARDDARFVQLQLCVLLQGCASVEGGGEAYRTLVVSGAATLLETARAILAAFGLLDYEAAGGPLAKPLQCIFEDVLVGDDGLSIENAEVPGLEWRDHATRVFHPEKQLKQIKTAALLDRPLFRRPRGERKGGGVRSHVSFLAKAPGEPEAGDRPRNGLYPFTVRCTVAGLNADMKHKCQAALPRCVAGGGAALGGSRVAYDAEKPGGPGDPDGVDGVNAAYFAAYHKKKNDPDAGSDANFAEVKAHLRLPLFELDLAAEYAQKNDL